MNGKVSCIKTTAKIAFGIFMLQATGKTMNDGVVAQCVESLNKFLMRFFIEQFRFIAWISSKLDSPSMVNFVHEADLITITIKKVKNFPFLPWASLFLFGST